jgi:hypothetical protein
MIPKTLQTFGQDHAVDPNARREDFAHRLAKVKATPCETTSG